MSFRIWHSFFCVIFLLSCDETKDKNEIKQLKKWEFQYQDEWYSAQVPGNNFSDLLSHKFILDPYYANNEDSIQWVPQQKWIYRTSFSKSKKEHHTLVFKGLDTYANVFLNDSLILQTQNMFRTYKADISNILLDDNKLIIHFLPIPDQENIKSKNVPYTLPGGSRVFTRKAGFHYGWDWGPKIATSGIWRPVELHSWSSAQIISFEIKQKFLSEHKADLEAVVNLEIAERGNYSLELNDSTYNFNLNKGDHIINLSYIITKPQKWWPISHGEQKLYEFKLHLNKGNNRICSESKKIGLRTISLISEKDSIGESFYFKINNKPIFMKGANYIPQDNLQNRVSDNSYRNLLQDVVSANMNMLRVWGGGIYEENIFYELCDSLGILVWQDFMFACAMYPGDEDFIENVRQEALDNVKRLSHHPSIALWCGNNESSEGWHRWGWQNNLTTQQREEVWNNYKNIFKEILPSIVYNNTTTEYWESSPKMGRGNPKHQFAGDAHYWGVWHDAEPFEVFEEKIPRFMSEFGFQSFPNMQTIKSFADSTQLKLDSDVMRSHQKHPRGNELILEYMKREYPVPKSFEKFVYASQVLQAEGIRKGLEAHRRNQPYCMGTLYWQLNDCWPVASWSSIDYYGNWKALHYAAQDVFAPIAISLSVDSTGKYSVWIMSDQNQMGQDILETIIFDVEGNESIMIDSVQIPENGSIKVKSGMLEANQIIRCSLKKRGSQSQTVFSKPVKEALLKDPEIETLWSGDTLFLTAKRPAHQIYLHGLKGHFSDNFFTLLPNEEKAVVFNGNPEEKNNLVIWSLSDLKK